ncbi:hypothetical protein B0A48_03371 [Cryoendolithus antarcticus]|uniref:FAD-binding domain-containing protein n=1 Tax=Cryoendolithus antarcticus TaxID=1507870 RepID=A0A1V8TK13_9PEZI|nr:hypothetical protein B0A48_03371 [Cryoendolithus antarcticus]
MTLHNTASTVTKPKPSPNIAILGAGPSGLLLSRLLTQSRIPHKIFDRLPSPATVSKTTSGTLDLHEGSGLLALERAGLLEAFKAKARYDVPQRFADAKGNVKLVIGEGEVSERPEFDRVDLQGLLLGDDGAVRVEWGRKVRGLTREGGEEKGGVVVDFENGKEEGPFDLVVGADGSWSKARSFLTSVKPTYTGRYALTSTLSPSSPFFPTATRLIGPGNSIAMGHGRIISGMKLGSGAYYVWAGVPCPSEADLPDFANSVKDTTKLKAELIEQHFQGWAEDVIGLLKEADGEWYAWPFYAMGEEGVTWDGRKGVTLVGDAAHLIPPNGEGVNSALYDSMLLAEQIIKHGVDRLDEAVVAYEAILKPRAKELIADTGIIEMMYAEDAPDGFVKLFNDMMGGEQKE